MARAVGIGLQSFEKIVERKCFYVDKTGFIREWWENQDDMTLITCPRRFGKTLNMSMLEQFLSVEYAGRGEALFGAFEIWKEKRCRELQGTFGRLGQNEDAVWSLNPAGENPMLRLFL